MRIKRIKPQTVKVLKIVHILASFSWVIGCIALSLIAFIVIPKSGDELYIYLKTLKIIDDYMVIGGVILAILTGLIYAIWTNWGFFKHRWIVVKWIMTIIQATFGGVVLGAAINENVLLSEKLRDVALTNPELLNNMLTIKIYTPIMAAFMIFLVSISVLKPWKKKTHLLLKRSLK